jgi:hypothetical protein
MRLLRGQLEASRQVNLPRRDQWIVGPQNHPLVPSGSGKLQTGVNQPSAQAVTAPIRMDQQDPELRRPLVLAAI